MVGVQSRLDLRGDALLATVKLRLEPRLDLIDVRLVLTSDSC